MSSARPLTTPDGRLALRLLEEAGEKGLSVAEMRAEGLQMPAQALYEVELAGWPLVRKAGRTRLRPAKAVRDAAEGASRAARLAGTGTYHINNSPDPGMGRRAERPDHMAH